MQTKKLNELVSLVRENSYLKSSLALLDWDQQTYLPRHAVIYRADQITFVTGEIHARSTSLRMRDLLSQLSESNLAMDPSSDEGTIIRELQRDYERQVSLPQDLVKAIAHASSIGQQAWREARHENDFDKFAPALKEIFSLKREQADAIGYEECRYDALLDEYEPNAKTSEVAILLNGLKDELVPLVTQIVDSPNRPDSDVLNRHFPSREQELFGREAAAKIGFDFDRGRLDITHHPFCMEAGPNDVRITTRYDESFFNTAFFGTLHEAGHGIYEQGLRSEFYGLPPGQYCSLGIHESQSRLWENLVGRSAGFWAHFYPRAQEYFPSPLDQVSQTDFVSAVNRVAPSLIRVEADEATYDLHIIIRFQLEQAVIDGELDVMDLPTAWNEKYQQYLGIQPASDVTGVLQDIHWSAGLIGYFPTYSLGNIFASQFFETAEAELGDLDEMFKRGEFETLRKWLNHKVHIRGKCLTSPELGKEINGKPLSHDALITHLRNKLAPIYEL